MKNTFLRGLTTRISALLVAALTLTVLPATTAFAASVYGIRSNDPITVGEEEDLEVYYTVDTAFQTWADGDTFSFSSPLGDWDDVTFSVEYDDDDENDGVGETAIVAGGANGQYSIVGTVLTVKWDHTTWGTANGSTVRIVIEDYVFTVAGEATFIYSGTTAAGGDTNPFGIMVGITAVAGALETTNVEPVSLIVSTKTTHAISFTTNVAIPNLGKILITYPAGWNVTDVAGTTAGSLTGLDGTWTATVAGQVVTLTQTGGTESAAGAKSFTLNGVYTPSTPGSGGTYTINTRNAANASIEIDSAVTADTIAAGVTANTSDINVGTVTDVVIAKDPSGHVLITWKDPSDASSRIDILRGKNGDPVNGIAYGKVEKGIQKFTDSDVKVGDELTYRLRAVDNNGNFGVLTETFSLVLTAGSAPVVVTEEETDEEDSEESAEEETPTVEEETSEEATPTPDAEVDLVLSDLEGHWSKDVVLNMVERGIVQGNDDGTFRPDGQLNRAEAAALLYRVLYGETAPTVPAVAPFSDVAVDQWFSGFIAKLKELEIAAGNPDLTYRPSASINRAEFLKLALATYYYNATAEQKSAVDALKAGAMTQKFADVAADVWYAPTVTVSYELGFIEGMACEAGTCFNPSSPITRAEATKILSEMFPE